VTRRATWAKERWIRGSWISTTSSSFAAKAEEIERLHSAASQAPPATSAFAELLDHNHVSTVEPLQWYLGDAPHCRMSHTGRGKRCPCDGVAAGGLTQRCKRDLSSCR
jgi:hypothetical protein